jgi:hypothetical protein
VSPHIPTRLAQEVRDRANEVCEYCLLPQNSQEATFHIDHVVPRREGDFEGLTPTGHATISALGMNRPAIVSIRKELHFTGRFPGSREIE